MVHKHHFSLPYEFMNDFLDGVQSYGVAFCTASYLVETMAPGNSLGYADLSECDLDSVELLTCGQVPHGSAQRTMVDHSVSSGIVHVEIPDYDPIPIPLATSQFGIRSDGVNRLYGYDYEDKAIYLAKTNKGYTLFYPGNKDANVFVAFCFVEKRKKVDHKPIERPRRKSKAPDRFGEWTK